MPSALRKEPRHSSPWLVIAVGLALAVLGGGLAWGWQQGGRLKQLLGYKTSEKSPTRTESPEQARQRRQSPAAELAPSPMPDGLPLLGEPGEDEYGMPTQYVDGPALRSLLLHKEYAKLNQDFERLQQEFDREPRKEYWPMDAAAAFSSAEPALRTQLDGWVATTPDSFAPYLARGAYLTAVAWAKRGFRYAKDTDETDFAAMAETLPLALADIERAFSIQPKSVAALRWKIKVFQGQSRKKNAREALERATSLCPSCFQVRVAYMMHLRPRWQGTREEMVAFASSVGSGDKKLRLLRGYADWDEAQTLREDRDRDKALEAINRACALGVHWEFLVERGRIHRRLKDLQAALEDMNAAWRARPGEPEILANRQVVFCDLARWEEAGHDLLALLRTRPTEDSARKSLDTVVKGLIYGAWERHKAGRREDGIRMLDLAAELQPQNRDVINRRAWIVEGRTAGPTGVPFEQAPDLGGLKTAAREEPDDFRAHQQLDYNLARQGKFAEVVEMWNAYLARKPGDGRAYLERGGAYFHMRKLTEAKADAAKACDLGISEGCLRAK